MKTKTTERRTTAGVDVTASASTSVYLLHGDAFLVGQAARKLVDALCPPDNRVFGLEELESDHNTVDQAVDTLRNVLLAVDTAGFLDGRKVVWFRAGDLFEKAAILRSPAVGLWLDRLVDRIRGGLPDGRQLVVTATGIDGRSALYKAFNRSGEAVGYTLPAKSWKVPGYARELAETMLDRAGLRADSDALDAFADAVGPDAGTIRMEVDKLALYARERKRITVDDVRAVVSPARPIEGWDLADRVGERDAAGALRTLRLLLGQRAEPIMLIGGLEARIRDLTIYRDGLDRGWLRTDGATAAWSNAPECAASLMNLGAWNPTVDSRGKRAHPFRVGLLAKQARKFSPAELARAGAALTRAREQMVGGFSAADLLLEFVVLRITRKPRP